MKTNEILDNLDKMIPNPKCELNYNKDYELLIATVLSAQCTDSRVNIVTKELFDKYDIYSLSKANQKDIEKIIFSCGNYRKKSSYIINLSKKLVDDYGGSVPNNREYLEKLDGVGRKTTNVVLSNLFNIPAIAVDTHVERTSKRLGLAKEDDSVLMTEKKLMKRFPKKSWSRLHHQLVLFGRYICKSGNPNCEECLFKEKCKYKNKKKEKII